MKKKLALALGATLLILVTAGESGADSTHGNVSFVGDNPQTVAAVDASGATASFTVSATDSTSNNAPLAVNCDHTSGSLFPLGTTTVSCSATDSGSVTESTSFDITVADQTAPNVAVPSGISQSTTSPAGVVVNYSASATDNVDGSLTPSCGPLSSGQTFPVGKTTVTCTATDAAKNKGQASFDVTVTLVDTTPPTLTVPAAMTVTAVGPLTPVSYTVSATDNIDASVTPTCDQPSGSSFPIGTTTVHCTATDSHGNTGNNSFTVTVVDQTAPVLTVPANEVIPATSSAGAVVAYSVSATDDVSGAVAPSCAPASGAMFPALKTTTVTCSAHDAAGNSSSKFFTVTVGDPPRPSAKAANIATRPNDVQNLVIRVASRTVILTWGLPSGGGIDHVAVLRTHGKGAKPVTVYRGSGTRLVDQRLKTGASYQYLVIAYDKSGNQSMGVVALARIPSQALLGPADGQRVSAPVVLRWRPAAGATFYNVQVFRGHQKVLSTWPTKAKLIIGSQWTYAGHREHFLPGRYTWYVWPARGMRKAPKYQPLEGLSSFFLVSV
jgi:hypothetical protein